MLRLLSAFPVTDLGYKSVIGQTRDSFIGSTTEKQEGNRRAQNYMIDLHCILKLSDRCEE